MYSMKCNEVFIIGNLLQYCIVAVLEPVDLLPLRMAFDY